MKEYTTRELNNMPFDKVFEVDGKNEMCHATGNEVYISGRWWNEYSDSNGDLHYGQ